LSSYATIVQWQPTGELAAVATAFLWTASTVAWTAAGRHIGSLAVSFLRLVFTCLILVGWGLAWRGTPLPLDAGRDAWIYFGLSGFMGFFLADVCLFEALLLIGPRLSLLILSLAPPLTALISWASLGDALSRWDCVAMAVTLSGVAWVVLERRDVEPHPPQTRRAGVALAFLAALTMAIGLVLAKRVATECDPGSATLIRAIGSMVGYLPMISVLRRWPTMASAVLLPRVTAILLFGTMCGPVLGVGLMLYSLRHCSAGVTSTIIATMPVIILPVAMVLYREQVSPRAALGAVISVAGVAMLMLY
jgi:drug/metabolite transporter (DMT)-like permease